MKNNYHILSWDSDFLGFKTAKVNASELDIYSANHLIESMKYEGVKLVYWEVMPQDQISIDTAQNLNAFLADEKTTYFMNLDKLNVLNSQENIVEYTENQVTEELNQIAIQTAEYSRFKVDSHFENEVYKKLYLIWIERSVKREIAENVLVFKSNDQIGGLITLARKNDTGIISLLGVHQNFRGQNIGTKLVNATIAYFQSNGIYKLEVVTQKANTPACRFYEKCGFNVQSVVRYYHLWL